jgi:hypothetical protein
LSYKSSDAESDSDSEKQQEERFEEREKPVYGKLKYSDAPVKDVIQYRRKDQIQPEERSKMEDEIDDQEEENQGSEHSSTHQHAKTSVKDFQKNPELRLSKGKYFYHDDRSDNNSKIPQK